MLVLTDLNRTTSRVLCQGQVCVPKDEEALLCLYASLEDSDVEVRTKAWAAAARLGGEPVSVLPAEAVKAGTHVVCDERETLEQSLWAAVERLARRRQAKQRRGQRARERQRELATLSSKRS